MSRSSKKPSAKATKVTKEAKEADWEEIRACLVKWHEAMYSMIMSLRCSTSDLYDEVRHGRSQASKLMNLDSLKEVVESLEDTLCSLDNARIEPLITDVIPNPVECLKRIGRLRIA